MRENNKVILWSILGGVIIEIASVLMFNFSEFEVAVIGVISFGIIYNVQMFNRTDKICRNCETKDNRPTHEN